MDQGIAIFVGDLIRIDPASGDAICYRTYTFRNSGASPATISAPLRIDLDSDAVLVSVSFNGQDAESRIQREPGAYQFTVKLFIGGETIAAGADAVVTIEYRWSQFLSKAIEPNYRRTLRISHLFEFIYGLVVSCDDAGFLATPAFKVAPDACRPPPPLVQISSDKKSYSLRTNAVPPGTTLAVTMSGGHGDLELPVLKELGERFKAAAPFEDKAVVFIQHLLADSECTIDAFVRAGLRPENAFIIGIPYSTKNDVHTRLQGNFGYVAPQFDKYPFDEHLPGILDQVLEHCRKRDQKYVVVEDGGYIARRFHEDLRGPQWAERCIGIVEQTRNGIRVTRDWLERHGPIDNPPNVGVVNVAETDLKHRLESPLIGKAVVFNVQRLLETAYEEQNLAGRRALVIGGCGSTGSQITRELIAQACQVTVVDARAPTADLPAQASYRPGEELLDAIAGHDLIIGCTGNAMGYPERDSVAPLAHEGHFARLKNRAVLVNASSKKAEFNLDAINNIANYRYKRGFGHERVFSDGRVVRIAADGFPVNFFNSESVPGYDIQPVLGMLFLAACRLIERSPIIGINDFTLNDQRLIEEIYNRHRLG
jgi:S-adenosylhomocysteine hydrolase